MSYKISAPGSVMLIGEYAVLQGNAAIVCAIDRRITVTLTPRKDNKIIIHSSLFNAYQTELNHLIIKKPYQFALTALQRFSAKIPSGLTLHIESDLPHQMGFGSSAAVTVATIGALNAWLHASGPSDASIKIFKAAKEVILTLQGNASGADVAASVFGRTLFYRATPFEYTYLPHPPPFILLYSGNKTPTAEAIAIVETRRLEDPKGFNAIFQTMANCTQHAKTAILQQDWQVLGEICNMAQDLMVAMGVSNTQLDQLIQQLRQMPSITGAKISGSGLGDCVLGIIGGRSNLKMVNIADQGLKNESV